MAASRRASRFMRRFALGEARRLAPLAVGFGVDQIGNGLGLGEIQPPGVEGAVGEFAGLRNAGEAGFGRRGQYGFDDRGTAMEVEFDDVLAGEGIGARHPEHQRFIDEAALGIAKDADGSAARRRRKVG
jgi:hypothetical protein